MRDALLELYSACDKAYLKDSVNFLTICEKNDSTAFLTLTGIKYDQLVEFSSMCKLELNAFIEENPEWKEKQDAPCVECSNSSLPELGHVISMASGHISSYIPPAIVREDYGRMMSCIWKCIGVPPCGHDFCIASCMGRYFLMKQDIKFDIKAMVGKEAMDEMYEEISYFHGYEVKKATSDEEGAKLPESKYLRYILNTMRDDAKKMDISYLQGYSVPFAEYRELWNFTREESTVFDNNSFSEIVTNNFDLKFLANGTNEIWNILVTAFESSDSEEDFVNTYNYKVKNYVENIENPNDYFCIYMSAAVCLNSFMEWSSYLYGNSNAKGIGSVWKSIKEKASEAIEKVKPYAEADLDGAAWGALVGAGYGAVGGAAAGPAGVAAGAASGAVDGAFQGAIAGSLSHWYNKHVN